MRYTPIVFMISLVFHSRDTAGAFHALRMTTPGVFAVIRFPSPLDSARGDRLSLSLPLVFRIPFLRFPFVLSPYSLCVLCALCGSEESSRSLRLRGYSVFSLCFCRASAPLVPRLRSA
jgi:hypothetical protein